MKIFVIGFSQSGKSTFTQTLAERLELDSIGGSEWTKQFGVEKTEPNYREIVTKMAIDYLAEFPFTCINRIKKMTTGIYPVLVEGLRNPFDFMNLLNPATDYVIYLAPNGTKSANSFDEGVPVIISNIEWLIATGLMSGSHFFKETSHDIKITKDLVEKYSLSETGLLRA